jgi:pimeloyl-ACP methyl ester carboxylesterase
VSYDFRGQGGSTAGEAPATWEDHLADLALVLEHHNLDDAYLLGSSISAVMCRDFAVRNPDAARGLIMAGPALSLWGVRRQRRITNSWLNTLNTQGMQPLFDHIFPIVFGDAMIESMGVPGYLGLRESFVVLHTHEQIEASLSVSLT